ncbi:unnamed protein product [Hymenolepis diminuta]|uniref:Uncharacterized protein n=1 Tax=Hymenolepis diminuta TaxID=6216 RepID=A0A564YK66_HYMDI|nr:unnamed protein product [Hymenolepis diminuta]
MIYDVEVGKNTWIRHCNKPRRRLTGLTINKRYLSLHFLINEFNSVHVFSPRFQITDQVMVPSRAVQIRIKPSRIQIDPSSKTYG